MASRGRYAASATAGSLRPLQSRRPSPPPTHCDTSRFGLPPTETPTKDGTEVEESEENKLSEASVGHQADWMTEVMIKEGMSVAVHQALTDLAERQTQMGHFVDLDIIEAHKRHFTSEISETNWAQRFDFDPDPASFVGKAEIKYDLASLDAVSVHITAKPIQSLSNDPISHSWRSRHSVFLTGRLSLAVPLDASMQSLIPAIVSEVHSYVGLAPKLFRASREFWGYGDQGFHEDEVEASHPVPSGMQGYHAR